MEKCRTPQKSVKRKYVHTKIKVKAHIKAGEEDESCHIMQMKERKDKTTVEVFHSDEMCDSH